MKRNKLLLLAGLSSLIVLAGISYNTDKHQAYAASADVIINEIMYNPVSGNEADEYLELHNTTSADIDIGSWVFTAGIGNLIPSGTILPAYGYALVSPNSAQTLATYGKTTIATYTGALSNGGETVTISNASSQPVNSVTYDDASPWPTSPDGNGLSLELRDPDLDNSDPVSWGG